MCREYSTATPRLRMRTEAGAINYLGLFAAFAVILYNYTKTPTSSSCYLLLIAHLSLLHSFVPVDHVNSRGLAL